MLGGEGDDVGRPAVDRPAAVQGELEAVRVGANEFLVKPVSAQALLDRLIAIVAKPRPIVQIGDYYGPEPRNILIDPIRRSPPAPAPDGTLLN